MIPDNKQAAVKTALRTAFGVEDFEDIQLITKGLSSALIFRIVVNKKPYLLRVITRTDAMADPSLYFQNMELGAEAGLGPQIQYLSVEDRISITDFILQQPFPIAEAREKLAATIKSLHALPKFPFRTPYFDRMHDFIEKFRASKALPDSIMDDVYKIYTTVKAVYPIYDEANMVSCHNDLKPENIIYDGSKPWLVDWEAAFLNDRYCDLAVVGNFVTTNEVEETEFLTKYFGHKPTDYQLARFYLMTQMMHVFCFIFFMMVVAAVRKIDPGSDQNEDFRSFHNRMWNGEIDLADVDARIQYGWVHRNRLLQNVKSKRFEDALQMFQEINQPV